MFTDDMQEEAKRKFREAIRDKIAWISGKCWEGHTDGPILDINRIIEAARALEATNTKPLSEEQIKVAKEEISHLKYLRMAPEIVRYLQYGLLFNGATREELGLPPEKEEQEAE